ncbi:MAG: superoxide dismutase family protein [Alphaproteobacteria bacterium]|nr:superoxide dismutase family protein [Alphaproteobacteria bacterium]
MADMIGLDGRPEGFARFTQTVRGVLIELDLHGVPTGAHGIHIHQNGNCEPESGFAKSGGHLSREPAPFAPRAHGYFAKGGPDAGDLPNQFSSSDLRLHASFLSNSFTLGRGERSLFGQGGASILIDAGPDDYVSQPSGKSGRPIACGIIRRVGQNRPMQGLHE